MTIRVICDEIRDIIIKESKLTEVLAYTRLFSF